MTQRQFDRPTLGMGINENEFLQFQKRHGPSIRISESEFVFRDGATGISSAFQSGLFEPPEPPDGFGCLSNRRRYWTEVLQRLTASFDEIKHDAMQEGGVFQIAWPSVAGEQPVGVHECLLKLKTLATEARGELASIKKQIAKTPEGVAEAARLETEKQREAALAESMQRQSASAQEQRAALHALSID